jgi:hypothetical protein
MPSTVISDAKPRAENLRFHAVLYRAIFIALAIRGFSRTE